jgi:excinuclease ABC subunit C
VGKSKNLRGRLVTYFQSQSAEAKAARIAFQSVRLVWEPGPHEFAALLRELELIRRWRPRFNVRSRPERLRETHLCLMKGSAPHFGLSRQPSSEARHVFGPLRPSERLAEAVLHLNHLFKLRDCPQNVPMRFANQRDLFGDEPRPKCLRMELGTCLGPCAAGCGTHEYQVQVNAALAMLHGKDLGPLEELERRMNDAAAAQCFERAAIFRDRWQSLAWLCERLGHIEALRKCGSFVYPLSGYHGESLWYLFRHGRLATVIAEPRLPQAAEKALALLKEHVPERAARRSFVPEDLEMGRLVQWWLTQHPDEAKRLLPPHQAREVCTRLLGDRITP